MELPASMVLFIAVFALLVDSKSQEKDSLSESSPPPPPRPSPAPPPPSPPLASPPAPRGSSPQMNQNSLGHRWRGNRPRLPPPAAKHKLNTGEKVGLSFVGIVSVLQVCVVGFLVFKRQQLFTVINRYQTCS